MTQPQAPHGTASQYRQGQLEEWGRYVAVVPIEFYGTRAYNPGDPVPVSAVVASGEPSGELGDPWIRVEWVTERDSGQPVPSATVPPPEPPTIDPATVGAPQGAAAAPLPESLDDSSAITSTEG